MVLEAVKSFFYTSTENTCVTFCNQWCNSNTDQMIRDAVVIGGIVVATLAIQYIPKVINEIRRWHYIRHHQSTLCINNRDFFEAAKWGNLACVEDGLKKTHNININTIDFADNRYNPPLGGSYDTPILAAIRGGHRTVVRLILGHPKCALDQNNPRTFETVSGLLTKNRKVFALESWAFNLLQSRRTALE